MRFNVALNQESSDLTAVAINFTGSGTNQIVAGVPGQIIKVFQYFTQVRLSTDLTALDGATALTGPMPMNSSQAWVLTLTTAPWFKCSPGNAFSINSSVATQVSGCCYYTQTQA